MQTGIYTKQTINYFNIPADAVLSKHNFNVKSMFLICKTIYLIIAKLKL